MDKEAEAIGAYQDAIALDSNLVDAYNNLGLILAKNGEITEAETVYPQGISVISCPFDYP